MNSTPADRRCAHLALAHRISAHVAIHVGRNGSGLFSSCFSLLALRITPSRQQRFKTILFRGYEIRNCWANYKCSHDNTTGHPALGRGKLEKLNGIVTRRTPSHASRKDHIHNAVHCLEYTLSKGSRENKIDVPRGCDLKASEGNCSTRYATHRCNGSHSTHDWCKSDIRCNQGILGIRQRRNRPRALKLANHGIGD